MKLWVNSDEIKMEKIEKLFMIMKWEKKRKYSENYDFGIR